MAWHLVNETNFLRLVAHGHFTPEELRAALAELETIEGAVARIPDRMIDLTGIAYSELRFPDIEFVAARRKARRFPNRFRSALVTSHPAQLGYARMFQTLNEHPDITIRIFDKVEAAAAWLDSAPDTP